MGTDRNHAVVVQVAIPIAVDTIDIDAGFAIGGITINATRLCADIVFRACFTAVVKAYRLLLVRGGDTRPIVTIIIVLTACAAFKVIGTDFVFVAVIHCGAFNTI